RRQYAQKLRAGMSGYRSNKSGRPCVFTRTYSASSRDRRRPKLQGCGSAALAGATPVAGPGAGRARAVTEHHRERHLRQDERCRRREPWSGRARFGSAPPLGRRTHGLLPVGGPWSGASRSIRTSLEFIGCTDRLLGRGVPLYRTVRTDAATPLSPERCAVYSLRNPDYCECSFVADRWCISRSAAAEFADCFRRLLGIAIVSTGPAPRNGLGSQREPPSKPFRDEKVSQWSTFPLFRRPRAPGRYL